MLSHIDKANNKKQECGLKINCVDNITCIANQNKSSMFV